MKVCLCCSERCFFCWSSYATFCCWTSLFSVTRPGCMAACLGCVLRALVLVCLCVVLYIAVGLCVVLLLFFLAFHSLFCFPLLYFPIVYDACFPYGLSFSFAEWCVSGSYVGLCVALSGVTSVLPRLSFSAQLLVFFHFPVGRGRLFLPMVCLVFLYVVFQAVVLVCLYCCG